MPLLTEDDLTVLVSGFHLFPTQAEVYAGNINENARQMAEETWDWQRTARDSRSPMIVDPNSAIIAGHHRFIAALLANVIVPDGVVKLLPRVTSRPLRAWSAVTVRAGFRP